MIKLTNWILSKLLPYKLPPKSFLLCLHLVEKNK